MNVNTAATIQYNSAAILTRQLQQLFKVATGTVQPGTVLNQQTFQIDPRCPFFYIYAMGGAATATAGPAFETTHSFYNGGTPVTSLVTGWGNQATLNAGPTTFVSVLTTPNDGIGYIHDPVSGICSAVNPGTLDEQGFIKRWTALCDTVIISTQLYGAAYDFTGPAQFVHGILQQPW